MKRGPAVRDEAQGLERIRRVEGGPFVPSVLYCDESLLVLEWIPSNGSSPAAEEQLGRALAALHSAPTGEWGGGSAWIGECPVDPFPSATAGDFYGHRLMELAGRCGLGELVERVVGRLPSLVPPGPPVLLHGDLWWGNVLWAADGRAVLIDPSVHGGHREEDLAMLSLFGSVPARLMEAYCEANPLDAGWEQRVDLWQLYPLLVHTVLFGGSYRRRAEAAARRYA
ncbi:MAG TPA: fructosamine kinase family protein [Acidimicrobiales bacterium]|nr:fructosamine kinase family protein [Acidimicrobiales bacterium]